MDQLVNVGVAQSKVASSPTALRTILGSCVAICIYDRIKKIGGLVHILLPNSQDVNVNPEKYADTGIQLLVNRLLKDGAKKEFMSAKIAGGASMFKFESNLALGKIGERNIEETKEILKKLGVPVLAEDVGGNNGRVVDFFLEDGRMKIKAAGEEKLYYKV
jgi:chemotaxis protein CheD